MGKYGIIGFQVLHKHNVVFIVRKVYCVALFSVSQFQKGWRKELFAALVGGSVKRVGDKVLKSRGETNREWKHNFLEH